MKEEHNKEEVLKFETDYALDYIKDGVLYSHTKTSKPTLEILKTHMEGNREVFKEHFPLPCLAIQPKGMSMPKDARDYMSSDELMKSVTATAVVTPSNTARITGNMYLKLAKPKFPIKIFTNQEKAMLWLEQYK